MARTTLVQNQLTAGELSTRMQGRFDLEQYYQGAKTLANMLPLPHGGATNRPGSRFISPVGDSTVAGRAIPFVFKTSDSYVILMQNQTLRFYRAQGQVQETAENIEGATQANPVVITITGHGQTNGKDIYITGVVGMTELNGRWFTVANTAANTLELSGEDGTGHTAYTSGGTVAEVYEVASPWLTAELFQVQFVQDADTMYLVHPNHKPRELTRSAHTSWTLGNYAPTADVFTSATNYPAAVALFEQRIVFGYTDTNPQRLWFSKSADIQNMTTGSGDADGFTKDIYARQANPIRWVVGSDDLVIGTTGGIWVVDRPSGNAPVTVSNFNIKRHVTHGAANIAPVEIDNQVLYPARRGQASNPGEKLRRFKFDETEADYVAPDLTLLAEHITEDGIDDMAWQQDGWRGSYESTNLPAVDRVLWAVRDDGVLLSFTFNPEERVVAWARHPPPSGSFESVAVIPGASGDEVWVVVNRTVDSATIRTVEFLDPDLFMDGAVTGTGTGTSWGPFPHLEGETLAVLVDGAPVADLTVSDFYITLSSAASESVMAGLAYTPEIELMPLEAPLRDGVSVGARKSAAVVVVRFLTTVGAAITASDRVTGDELPFRTVSDDVEDPIPPFTGDKEIIPPASWQDPIVKITQPNSLPITVQAVAIEFEAHR